jgi:uncharacterized protein (TIGR00251 family)
VSAPALPPFLREQDGCVHLNLKVQPRASRSEVGEVVGNELKLKVTAPPVDSAANEAVLRLLAEKLECSRSALQLIRGGTSRHKTVSVRGLQGTDIARRLTPGSS